MVYIYMQWHTIQDVPLEWYALCYVYLENILALRLT